VGGDAALGAAGKAPESRPGSGLAPLARFEPFLGVLTGKPKSKSKFGVFGVFVCFICNQLAVIVVEDHPENF
jgi:hypothetical protein